MTEKEMRREKTRKRIQNSRYTMQVYVEGLSRKGIDVYRQQIVELLVVRLLLLLAETLQELHPLQRV